MNKMTTSLRTRKAPLLAIDTTLPYSSPVEPFPLQPASAGSHTPTTATFSSPPLTSASSFNDGGQTSVVQGIANDIWLRSGSSEDLTLRSPVGTSDPQASAQLSKQLQGTTLTDAQTLAGSLRQGLGPAGLTSPTLCSPLDATSLQAASGLVPNSLTSPVPQITVSHPQSIGSLATGNRLGSGTNLNTSINGLTNGLPIDGLPALSSLPRAQSDILGGQTLPLSLQQAAGNTLTGRAPTPAVPATTPSVEIPRSNLAALQQPRSDGALSGLAGLPGSFPGAMGSHIPTQAKSVPTTPVEGIPPDQHLAALTSSQSFISQLSQLKDQSRQTSSTPSSHNSPVSFGLPAQPQPQHLSALSSPSHLPIMPPQKPSVLPTSLQIPQRNSPAQIGRHSGVMTPPPASFQTSSRTVRDPLLRHRSADNTFGCGPGHRSQRLFGSPQVMRSTAGTASPYYAQNALGMAQGFHPYGSASHSMYHPYRYDGLVPPPYMPPPSAHPVMYGYPYGHGLYPPYGIPHLPNPEEPPEHPTEAKKEEAAQRKEKPSTKPSPTSSQSSLGQQRSTYMMPPPQVGPSAFNGLPGR